MSRCSRELFLEVCGLSGPLQLDIEAGGEVETRTFEQPFVVIGRDPGADLILDHEQVSRKHAYLQVIAGRVFCIDLDSRTGVHWDHGAERSGWVDGRGGIRIGPFQIRAGGGAEPAHREDPLTTRGQEDSSLPVMTLEFPHLANQRSRRTSRVLTLLGRAPGCRLRWNDPEVSKFHCSLLRTPAGVWVISLLGRGGIAVNGQRVRWDRLEHDDQLQIGPHLIQIRSMVTFADPMESEIVAAPRVASRLRQSVSMPAVWGGPAGGMRLPLTVQRRAAEVGNEARFPAVVRLFQGRGVVESQDVPALLKAELIEPILDHMANQFGQMQQQMCDQFQQSMMMMAQMFGALHRDQMERAREELDQIRQLNQDFLALQAELATRTSAAIPPTIPSPDDPATVEALARIEALLLSSPPHNGLLPVGAPLGPGSAGPEPMRASSPPPAPTRERAAFGTGATATESRAPGEKIADLSSVSGSAPDGDHPESSPDESTYTLLHQRIAEIQRERQGRWQRVLELMFGR